MTRMTAATSARAAFASLAMVGAGAAAATVSAATQAVAARAFDAKTQAVIAIAISAGAMIATVVSAMVLESRLADSSLSQKSYLPRWSILTGVIGGALIALTPLAVGFLVIGLPLVMLGLQVGRVHAISTHAWRGEVVTGTVLGVGSIGAFLLSLTPSEWAFPLLGVAVIGAHLARAWNAPVRADEHPRLGHVVWVGLETSISAVVPLALNTVILATVDAESAVAFRLVLTVLGVLQPVLGYLRTRLLSINSQRTVLAFSSMTVVTLAAVIVLHFTDVFRAIFDESWVAVSTPALLLACVWKLLSIPTTIPFTSLRRQGKVRLLFCLRLCTSVIYIGLGSLASAHWGSLGATFLSLAIAEGMAAILFAIAAHIVRLRAETSSQA